ncbi:MAG: hypothetical protein JWM44_499 [Bacilli bacterium]|nr:hypothetical protein [Bacilli bacterium]
MDNRQNYVSSELTHFVGRGLSSDDDRYNLFVNIIETGLLRGKIDNGKGSTLVNVDPNNDFSSNDSYNVNMVCFCDIPVNDFKIHMSKYSHFGIAFSKDFLIRQGARPVYYIPKDALTVNQNISELFNKNVRRIGELHYKSSMEQISNMITQEGNIDDQYHDIFHFIDMQLLSFFKFYDHNKIDDDIDNFYMEREWRSLERIEFEIQDIKRIVIPSTFIKKFFRDMPNYNFHITTV